jgi:hypothetical protein
MSSSDAVTFAGVLSGYEISDVIAVMVCLVTLQAHLFGISALAPAISKVGRLGHSAL